MRLVKTEDEIKRIHAVYARCHLLGARDLMVYFETTPAAVRALLPRPLEPTAEPVGMAWVGEVANSTCVGPFSGTGLFIRARYGDIVGNYCVTKGLSTTEAVTFGRELYGEPSKLANIIFEQQDEHVWGSGDRHDIRYISMRGRLEETAQTGRIETSTFYFKFSPRSDGVGFEAPPKLIHVIGDASIDVARRGRGELVFRDSAHDPVADIPVKQVIEAVYTEGHVYTSGRVLCEVDPEAFLPHAFNRLDAIEAVAEGTFLHAQAARKTREGKGQWRNNSS